MPSIDKKQLAYQFTLPISITLRNEQSPGIHSFNQCRDFLLKVLHCKFPSSTCLVGEISFTGDRILPPCNYCHHPWCFVDKSHHRSVLIMLSCYGISDHVSLSEVSHYWDTKLSWQGYLVVQRINYHPLNRYFTSNLFIDSMISNWKWNEIHNKKLSTVTINSLVTQFDLYDYLN